MIREPHLPSSIIELQESDDEDDFTLIKRRGKRVIKSNQNEEPPSIRPRVEISITPKRLWCFPSTLWPTSPSSGTSSISPWWRWVTIVQPWLCSPSGSLSCQFQINNIWWLMILNAWWMSWPLLAYKRVLSLWLVVWLCLVIFLVLITCVPFTLLAHIVAASHQKSHSVVERDRDLDSARADTRKA